MVTKMNAYLNRIATPLTTSLFLVSLVTGLALFLHIGPGGLHPAHEWLSLALILPFALHLWRNWRAFTVYFRKPAMAVALALGILGTGYFLLPAPQGQGAALGTTPEALMAGLAAQGIAVADPARPLAEAAAGRDDAAMAAALLASRQP
jgi:hypothetical protein